MRNCRKIILGKFKNCVEIYLKFLCVYWKLSNFCYFTGLVKGLNQVGKALDRKDAYLCILAKDCDDPKYKKLISALAKQNKIHLIEVDSRLELGEWLGQCKYDKKGVARKVKGCSSVAIKEYGESSEALTYLENYIKENDLWEVYLFEESWWGGRAYVDNICL